MDIKQLYRSIYLLVKQLDERKTQVTTVADLFTDETEQLRKDLIKQSEQLIALNHESIGKKAREIFWRKGFYDVISVAKRIWNINSDSTSRMLAEKKLIEFILAAIDRFKKLIIKFESDYEMNLKFIIDFESLDMNGVLTSSSINNIQNNINESDNNDDLEPLKFPYETITYALETIHAMLLSIGDFHRYFIEFKFSKSATMQPAVGIDRDYAGRFYYEAFKLNPTIGMAQNQLGTLYSGMNYNLDSLYYYLYSLICPHPFELSENNVMIIFQKNSEYLENRQSSDENHLTIDADNDNIDDDTLHNFMAEFILIVDIFFYDKEVVDFNMLCHCTLLGLRELLRYDREHPNSSVVGRKLPKDFWYKIVTTLLFCAAKLKTTDSARRYSLNAFLVAICSELIDSCIANLEMFIEHHSVENSNFQTNYMRLFEKFDEEVRQSREKYRLANAVTKDERQTEIMPPILLNGSVKLHANETDGCSVQSTINNTTTENSIKKDVVKPAQNIVTKSSSEVAANNGGVSVGKKCTNKLRRRRKRINSYDSNVSDSHDDDDDDVVDDENDANGNDETDNEMNSDFSSDELTCGDGSLITSSDEFDGDDDEDDDDNNDENDENNTNNYSNTNGQSFSPKFSHQISPSKNIEIESSAVNGHLDFSDNDDFVIEEEQIVYSTNNENDDKNTNNNNNNNNNNSNKNICTYFLDPTAELIKNLTNIELTSLDFCFIDDDKDLIVEEETMVFSQKTNEAGNEHSSSLSDCNGKIKSVSTDENNVTILNENGCDDIKETITDQKENDGTETKQEKLRYKRKYSKVDPNIIIEFACHEHTLQALKILFDWLKINNEILTNCFATNPEFVHKIMKLLNHFNIDIFTNKVYFERDMLTTENIREDFRLLFDIIGTIPMHEDVLLKRFSELKNPVQQHLDWEVRLKSGITEAEENILRIFKLVDFGFFLCKMKKFKYNFCARSRRFTEMIASKKKDRISRIKNGHNQRVNNNNNNQKRRSDRRRGYQQRKGNRDGISGNYSRNKTIFDNRNAIDNGENIGNNNENEDVPLSSLPKKSYLKNRPHLMDAIKQPVNETINMEKSDECTTTTENKYELMGKLWLRNEVKTLESKMKKPTTLFTPYLVMDTKSLTEYTAIVKNLIKTKKFIVLIPNAVISELDELKKTSERARNAIRWLEKEFSKGSRFLRTQRKQEALAMPLLKLPKKLDRDALTFVKIVEFCNYIQKHHSIPLTNGNDYQLYRSQQIASNNVESTTDTILTLLTGDQLNGRKSIGFSYTGIMSAMSINFESISVFYAKYKKK